MAGVLAALALAPIHAPAARAFGRGTRSRCSRVFAERGRRLAWGREPDRPRVVGSTKPTTRRPSSSKFQPSAALTSTPVVVAVTSWIGEASLAEAVACMVVSCGGLLNR
jgi:hypothetical protein